MKILLTAATSKELEAIREVISEEDRHQIEYLVTGVGMIATTFSLTEELAVNQHDLTINIGIAGAFDRSLQLGEVIEVVEDQFSEEWVEDGEQVRTYEEIGLRGENEIPFEKGVLKANYSTPLLKLEKVKAITVNTVHGNEHEIQKVQERLNPQIESMEGAAFFYVCQRKKQHCIQLRAISNYVEKRNRKSWKVDLALNNLAEETLRLIQQL